MEITVRWNDEDIGRVVEAARASRQRAEIMREHCRKTLAKLRVQQRRIAALSARRGRPAGVKAAAKELGQ